MRSSLDDQTYVTGYDIGNTIKFKVGFRIFGSATTGLINGGKMDDWLTYTMIEESAAVALTASLAAYAVTTLVM